MFYSIVSIESLQDKVKNNEYQYGLHTANFDSKPFPAEVIAFAILLQFKINTFEYYFAMDNGLKIVSD